MNQNDDGRPIHQYDEFEMFSYGPIFPEVERHPDFTYRQAPHWQAALKLHEPLRNRVAALECKLARELKSCGYPVMNDVLSKATLNPADWPPVRDAFAAHFEKLKDKV
ncbi:hypothetical protein K6M90_19485 [Rhizobium sp. 9T]|uniref:hypothetical protein n=1 Tax=Rhizobium croatiense TaxID=2867516 RepID=UPI001C933A4D|nr:hypothetical protein [Rhizobium croatiense]MBY4609826.1 hypothetical protein [Rhizobium croatiense]